MCHVMVVGGWAIGWMGDRRLWTGLVLAPTERKRESLLSCEPRPFSESPSVCQSVLSVAGEEEEVCPFPLSSVTSKPPPLPHRRSRIFLPSIDISSSLSLFTLGVIQVA